MATRPLWLICMPIVAVGLAVFAMAVPYHALAQTATPNSQTIQSDPGNDAFDWDDAKTILVIAGGLFGLFGGTGGLIGFWRTRNQERREQSEAFFATYEKSIATLTKQYDRESDPASKEEKRKRLETKELEYHEQLEAYRASSALRQAAPRGSVAAGDPTASEADSALFRALLERSRALSPALGTADYYLSRANAAYELKSYEEALADHNRSLELRPDDPDTLNNRGNTLNELKRYEEALADYNRSLELQPDDPVTLNNRGVTLDDLKRYEEALADYNRSLELRPDYPSAFYNRACLFSITGRLTEVLAELKRAISLDVEYRAKAREDEDFANLRADPQLGPEFELLVTESET